jgi:hypothetical protein
LHGPIARPPGIVGRDQPDVLEVGIVERLADIDTERAVAVLEHVVRPRLGRVAALAHRSDVEELALVLCRARERLDVLDLGGPILDVETVPDAQVDAVVDVDLIRAQVSRLDLVGRRDPSLDLSRLRKCDLGLAGRRLACDKYQPATALTSRSAPAINQPAGIRRQKGRVSAASGDQGGVVQPAIEPGSDGGSVAGRLAQGGGAQSTAPACCGNAGSNSVAGGRLASSSAWFGNSVLMTAPR